MQTAAYAVAAFAVRPFERLCVRAGIGANAITVSSLVVAMVAGVAAARDDLAMAGAIYLVAGALDLLDGRVARATGTASARGAALDSIVDRFAEGSVVGGLAWALRATPGVALCIAFLVASMGVSYARARGEGLGVKIETGAMNRGARVVLLAVAMIVEGLFGDAGASTAFLAALALLVLATAATAAVRVALVLHALPRAEHAPRRAPFRSVR